MSFIILFLAVMAVLTITVSPLNAAVKPNALFSSNAVLQREMPVPVWGDARDGENVTVEFRGQTVATTARNGMWKVTLQPMTAGGPYTMTITGDDNKIELRNIMVGEVWLCGGQSNMEWPLKLASTGEKAIASSADPMLRLFHTPRVALDNPVRDVNSNWNASKLETTPDFSAVGYFFGRELRKSLNIPIGLINANQGATMAEAWMPRNVLEGDPDYKKVFDIQWPKEYEILRPTGLYNGMIAPIQGYAMRGVIWYQGESNAGQAFLYRRVFPAMMKVWRDKWGIDDLTFLTTQLAPFEFEEVGTEPRDSTWAELREAQLLTMQNDPNTGMAVITDAGDPKDIHPADKETVGIRLSLIARAKNYGEKIVYSGPIYDSMKVNGNKAVISFKHTGSGLLAKGGALKGFAIAGEDKKFVWADAVIKGNKVAVSSPKVKRPVAVRYGWANCPDVNLFNKENLPASPFRTDDFQMLTAPK
ncbi:MAG: sialate O-acetylesterase [Armatimonadota bacterium]